MASGEPALFEQLKPIFNATTERLYRIGDEIGLGSTVKTIHQLLAGVHIAVAAESMALAAKAGISLDLMYDIVTHAAGNSWMFENRVPHILAGDYTPKSSVDIFVKDLGLVLETGKALRFPLPLSATAHQMFLAATNEGFGQWDDSAVIKTFKGITLPEKEL
ncbi:NAD-binding protein [Photorhabdus heterorhabditis]|uniref:NAD-binding protein n=1 Tax=Photorhabdus heterorhabditis TaxID=880156 RepID=UPI000AF4AF3A